MANISAKILAIVIFVWFGGMTLSDLFNIHIHLLWLKIIVCLSIFLLMVYALVIDILDHRKTRKNLEKQLFGGDKW